MSDDNMVNPIQVQKFLGSIDYPCNKETLIETAKKNGADENIMKMLEELPDQDFQTPVEVSQALGEIS